MVKEINILKMRARFYCDAPMRAFIRRHYAHGAFFMCDVCEAEAESLSAGPGKQSKRILPYIWDSDKPRTHENLVRFTNRYTKQEIHDMDRDEQKGVKGKSILLGLEQNFNIYNDLSVDPMHHMCEGVVKRVLSMLVKMDEKAEKGGRPGRRRIPVQGVNHLIRKILVPSEFSRRANQLENGLKAEEYRNISLFYFPCILCLLVKAGAVVVWALLSWLMRCYYAPDDEFDQTTPAARDKVIEDFMAMYVKYFGLKACVYNFHLVRHLEVIRSQGGPFADASCMRFEGHFSHLTRGYVAGTANVPKQGINSLNVRKLHGHDCSKKFIVRDKTTSKADDSLVYTFSAECGYTFYKIVRSFHETDGVIVVKARKEKTNFGLAEKTVKYLNWASVGVFAFLEWAPLTEAMMLPLTFVAGKGIRIDSEHSKYIMSVPFTLLREQ
jgi:hypothetical protein